MDQHTYLLRTNKEYREAVATETLLKLTDLLVVLAHRNGIDFDPVTGKMAGLSADEEKLLASSVPSVNVDSVKEFRPEHVSLQAQPARPSDTYVGPSSETVGDSQPDDGSFLVKAGDVPGETENEPDPGEDAESGEDDSEADSEGDNSDSEEKPEEAPEEEKPRRRGRRRSSEEG